MEENLESPNRIKKIVVVGPESTGKSELTEALAKHYNTVWVPEYARRYINNLDRPYQKSDLIKIAEGQIRLENQQSKKAKKMFYCDTNLWVIKIWSEHKYGNCDAWINKETINRDYDLHLLADIDLPWEEDPQREHPMLRKYFFDVYKNELENAGINYSVVSGIGPIRLKNAISAIETFI